MKRRLLACILAIAMTMTLLPATALAADPADGGEVLAEADTSAPAEETEQPTEESEEVQPAKAELLQARIDALPAADEVAALMESDPDAVDAVYEEVRTLMEAVEALAEELDTGKLDALVELFTPEAEMLAGVECSGGADCTHEAAIGNKHYDSLAAALSDGKSKTVKLLKDVQVTAKKTLSRYTYTIDLNDHNIKFARNCFFRLNSGVTLNLTGTGKLYEEVPTYSPIVINGTAKTAKAKTTFNVGKDVILEGFYGGFIDQSSSKNQNIIVKVEGTLIGSIDTNGRNGAGFYIHGNFKDTEKATAPQITITETAHVSGPGCGIYAAGYANWNLAGNVTGNAGEALSIKSGTFNITGGTYTAKGAFADPAAANSNGSESTGAALSITSNDGYAKMAVVNVTGGTFISENGYAVYEGIAKKADDTPAAAASYATLNISSGAFTGNADKGAVNITTAEDKRVITGGTFNQDVTEYVGPGYVCKQYADGAATHIVVPLTAEEAIASVTSAEKTSYYASLADAITATEDGDTVTLLDNATISDTLTVDKAVTLDLAGHKVTGPQFVADQDGKPMLSVKAGGNLALMTSEPNGTLDYNNRDNADYEECISVNEGGICSITGITICNAGYAIANNGGTITKIMDCTITDSYRGINTSGTIEKIAGTTITNNTNGALYITNGSGTVTELSGNNFTSEVDAIFCSGNVAITDGVYTSTGGYALEVSTGTVTVNGGVFTSGDDAAAYTEGELIINGGDFAGGNGVDALDCSQDWGGSIEVSSGYFTSDVTKYCVAGKMAIANTDDNQTTYAYKVGDIVEQEIPGIKDAAISGETEAAVGTGIASKDTTAAQAVAESVKPDNLPVSAVSEATKKSESSDAIVKLKANNVINVDDKGAITDSSGSAATVTVVRETYLDVEITSYTDTAAEQEVTLEIEPKYNLIATIENVAENTGSGELPASKTVTIEQGKPLTVTDPVVIKVNLPSNFAEGTAYIEHTKVDGTVYIYTGTVTVVGTNKVLTFTNPNGFSIFKVVAKNPAAAVVKDADGNVMDNYPTLQAAIDAVQDGETVEVLKGDSAAVSGNKTFTVKKAGDITATLTAAPGYDLTDDGNGTYTVTKAAVPATGVSLDSTSLTLSLGGTAALTATVAPDNATDKTVTWTSSNEGVVKVDESGKLTAVGYGTTIITAKVGAFSAACTVEVPYPYIPVYPGPVVPVQPAAPVSELPFVDVDVKDAFYEVVKYVYDTGLMTGTDINVFAPYGDFTRAQVATILFRLEKEPETAFAPVFPDVAADQWFTQAVLWGNSEGILLGYSNGRFGPNNAVTMEQLLTILYRYAGIKGYDTKARADVAGFDCADYAAEAVSWAAAYGMVDATSAATLRSTAARWQVAQVLSVFCQTVVMR